MIEPIKKKREVLPVLHKAIQALVNLSADCAKVEISDNDQASKRLKRDVHEFKNNEFKELRDLILSIRLGINIEKKNKKYAKKATSIEENLTT